MAIGEMLGVFYENGIKASSHDTPTQLAPQHVPRDQTAVHRPIATDEVDTEATKD